MWLEHTWKSNSKRSVRWANCTGAGWKKWMCNCVQQKTNWRQNKYVQICDGNSHTRELRLILCCYVCACLVTSVMSDSLWRYGLLFSRLLCPWNSPARILEWVAMPSSRGFFWPRNWIQVSHLAGRFFFFFFLTICVTWEAPFVLISPTKYGEMSDC